MNILSFLTQVDLKKFVPQFILIYLISFAVYLFLSIGILRFAKKVNTYPYVIIATAIGLLLLLSTPTLSKDIYRYLWDGLLVRHGINPYLYLPQDQRLSFLHNLDLYAKLDFKDKFTVYPPMAQFIFAVASFFYELGGVLLAKILFVLPIIILSVILCKKLGTKLFIIFILNPLVLFEIFYGAHIDAWASLFIVASILMHKSQRHTLSSIFLAFATLTKVFPLLFFPLFIVDLIRHRKNTQSVKFAIVFILTLIIGYAPFLRYTVFPLTRYLSVGQDFEFNSLIYPYLKAHFHQLAPFIALLTIIIAELFILTKKFSIKNFIAIYLCYLLLSSIVYPWYLVILFPLVILYIAEFGRKSLFFYFIFFGAIISLSYISEISPIVNFELRQNELNILASIQFLFIMASIFFYRLF